MKEKALKGIKVLEYCSMVSGPYCAKLMADMGAEVIKIESPGRGDAARERGPFPGNISHSEKSGLFLYLNTNKMGVTLDPRKPEGKRIFEELVKDIDVLIEDKPPGELEGLGLGFDDLTELNPGLIMVSITPFGLSGSNKNHKAYPFNVGHVSGQSYLLPMPSLDLKRPPVKTGGNSSDYDPGLVASIAVLSALYWKGVSGKGQFIEISKQEALISMQRVESVTYANDKVSMSRGGQPGGRSLGGVMPCKDGYVVVVTPEEHQWRAFMTLLGDPDWSKEKWCADERFRAENAAKINKHILAWMKDHTKEEIFRKGQALSCPIAPLKSAQDVLQTEQLIERDFFVETDHPEMGRVKIPATPYHFSKTPPVFDLSAPLLGQHNQEIFGEGLGYSQEELKNLTQQNVI